MKNLDSTNNLVLAFTWQGDNIRAAPYQADPPSPARSMEDVSDASLSPPSPPLPPPPPPPPQTDKTESNISTCKYCEYAKFGCEEHPRCLECDNLGHETAECPRYQKEVDDDIEVITIDDDVQESSNRSFACSSCNQLGHVSSDCPQQVPAPTATANIKNKLIPSFICLFCMKPGHRKKDCPEIPPGATACHYCSKIGHSMKRCPERKRSFETGLIQKNHCDYCKVAGHSVCNCSRIPKDTDRCMCCLKVGHKDINCPLRAIYKDKANSSKTDRPNNTTSGTSGYPVETPIDVPDDAPDVAPELSIIPPLPPAGSTVSDVLSIPVMCSCCKLLGHIALDCPMNNGGEDLPETSLVNDESEQKEELVSEQALEKSRGSSREDANGGSRNDYRRPYAILPAPLPRSKEHSSRSGDRKSPISSGRKSSSSNDHKSSNQAARQSPASADKDRHSKDRKSPPLWNRRSPHSRDRNSAHSKSTLEEKGREQKSKLSADPQSHRGHRDIHPSDKEERTKTSPSGDIKSLQNRSRGSSPSISQLLFSGRNAYKSLDYSLQALSSRGVLRYTNIARTERTEERKYLISILQGDNFARSLKKIGTKAELREALVGAGVDL